MINIKSNYTNITQYNFQELRTKNIHQSTHQNGPLVSVITVVCNGCKYITQAIKSVHEQSYNNIEHIIIDGGSTDGTIEILNKHDHIIDYWISEPDEGIYDAMNKGIKCAKGDWLLFLGADDILLDSVHKFVHEIKDKSSVYYGDVIYQSNSRIYDGKFNILKLIRRNIPHQGTFFPKSIFKDNLYDTTFNLLADYAFNLRMYSKTNYVYLPIVFAKFNDKGMSSKTVDYAFREKLHSIIKDNYHYSIYLIFSIAWWATSFLRRK